MTTRRRTNRGSAKSSAGPARPQGSRMTTRSASRRAAQMAHVANITAGPNAQPAVQQKHTPSSHTSPGAAPSAAGRCGPGHNQRPDAVSDKPDTLDSAASPSLPGVPSLTSTASTTPSVATGTLDPGRDARRQSRHPIIALSEGRRGILLRPQHMLGDVVVQRRMVLCLRG